MTTQTTDPARAFELITRGVEVKTPEALRAKLAKGKRLRVKLGADPTSKDLHLGHAIVLRKMRLFQDLGHQAVLIIGDYTAQVGDPTGKSATRPILSGDEVKKNAQTYIDQIGKIVDVPKLEVRWNGEWFSKLQFLDVIKLAAKFTVARLLERDDFQKRMKEQQPLGFHELMYPMMQAYDSVMVEADIELGGTDQLFNLLAGRGLQPDFGQEPQVCITSPLLVGLDGAKKMSKSYDNYVGIAEPPEQQYGKSMSIPDALMRDWYTLCTEVPLAEVEQILAGHPNEAKKRLAHEIVRTYHGDAGAERGAEHFRKTVVEKAVPDEMPEHVVATSPVWIVELLRGAFKLSGSDARRLVQQGAVSVDGAAIADVDHKVEVRDGQVLKAGKRQYSRLKLRPS
jgi:tyrosyl-tRNA synthetase